MLEHWHTGAMTRRSRVLDHLEPEAVASLNPRQLRGMGLDAGDMVQVATRRGEISLQVRADGDVPEGLELGSAPVCTSVTNAHLVCRLLLDTTNPHQHNTLRES